MSAIITWGLVSLIAARAPLIVSASPHTCRSSSCSMIQRNPSRTIGCLSMIRIRAAGRFPPETHAGDVAEYSPLLLAFISFSRHPRAPPTLLVLREQLINFLGRNRPTVKIALRLIAIQLSQQLELLGSLDAFGDRQQAECRRQTDNRAGERHAG